MSTNIRVKFRTYQLNAFIFMASGRTDYCLMRLNQGTIEFTYKIEENIVQVRHKFNSIIYQYNNNGNKLTTYLYQNNM